MRCARQLILSDSYVPNRRVGARRAEVTQIDNSFSDCISDEIGTGVEAKSLHDPIFVKGDGGWLNVQDAGRLLHGFSFCQQLNYFELSRCEGYRATAAIWIAGRVHNSSPVHRSVSRRDCKKHIQTCTLSGLTEPMPPLDLLDAPINKLSEFLQVVGWQMGPLCKSWVGWSKSRLPTSRLKPRTGD